MNKNRVNFQMLVLIVIISVLLAVSLYTPRRGWYKVETSLSPQATTSAAIAYDSQAHKAILFGGTNAVLVNNAWQQQWLNETWEFAGNTWKKLSPANLPDSREKHMMAYDASRNRIVLFGGTGNGLLFGDTWEWDGTNWEEIKPAHSPSARCCHAMTYDSVRRQVVLYGGWDSNKNIFYNDIWIWDGEDWLEVDTDAPNMSGHFLIDFPAKQEVISIQTAGLGTWVWNGNVFADLFTESPPSRSEVRAVYDSKYDRVIMFGGIRNSQEYLGDTWAFNGESWLQFYPPSGPSPRFGQVMFYDSAKNRIVLFGGQQADTPHYLNDTWELILPGDISGWTTPLPPP